MWIKICGNTNLEDASLVADAGANAAGFVFAPGRRTMTAAQVAAFTSALPSSLNKIGVFGSHSFDEIAFTVRTSGLNGVQLHGDPDLRLVERLRMEFDGDLFLIQTLHWRVNGDSGDAERKFRDEWRAVVRHNGVDAVHLDTQTNTAVGGTGISFDWVRARAVLDREGGSVRIIVAGGLHPGNVAEAIRVFKPWGVDVASGTETAPGKKDPEKVRAFVAAALAAECGN
jgi:phosphoribosylanthranilate isomerase